MLNRAAQSTKTSAFYGELLKRFKSAVLKTARSERARAFESHIPRHSTLRIGVLGIASKYMRNRYVGLAQLVERRADNAEVNGSIPFACTICAISSVGTSVCLTSRMSAVRARHRAPCVYSLIGKAPDCGSGI